MKKTFTNTLKYFFNALFLVTLCLCNTTNVLNLNHVLNILSKI